MKLLLVFVLWFGVSVAHDSLCSNSIYENKCICKTFTNEETNLPSSMANCNGLNIDSFPDFVRFPNDLTFLDLSMNKIQALDPSAARSNGILKKLSLSFNGITELNAEFFSAMPNLRWLDLSHNNISVFLDGDVFLQQKNLTHLDLSFNNFKELPSGVFTPLPLQFLDLSYNPLGNFLMGSKEVLNSSLGIFSNISRFHLNNVGLAELYPDYFGTFHNLKHLELQDNALKYIPSLSYSIEYLDFSGNNLVFVSAKYLNYHSLKVLKLSRMPDLMSIHHYAFYNLQSLESLIITDSGKVEEFTELAFGLASNDMDVHPKRLVLARNGLRSLNNTYAYMFRNMDHIDLRHNPWDCTCDILWLQEFSTKLFKGREIRCSTPGNLKRKRVLDLGSSDLPQCYPEIYGKTSHKLTIVVLMGAVLFLMGLIFYLIRYPRSWLTESQMGIGPNSPYSRAPENDSRV